LHTDESAADFARLSAGKSNHAKIVMTAMTTSSSMSVNPASAAKEILVRCWQTLGKPAESSG
jgi:hypothetical protein